MKCPVCTDITLTLSERQGIEIDYCPQCRGVWLDRGELDKLIERAQAQSQPPAAPQPVQAQPQVQPAHYQNTRAPQGFDHERKPYHKKEKSWLSDIFD